MSGGRSFRPDRQLQRLAQQVGGQGQGSHGIVPLKEPGDLEMDSVSLARGGLFLFGGDLYDGTFYLPVDFLVQFESRQQGAGGTGGDAGQAHDGWGAIGYQDGEQVVADAASLTAFFDRVRRRIIHLVLACLAIFTVK